MYCPLRHNDASDLEDDFARRLAGKGKKNMNEDKLLKALESIADGEAVPDKELPHPTVDATRLFRRQDMIKARNLMTKYAGDTLAMARPSASKW
jgi:hypothetical protein